MKAKSLAPGFVLFYSLLSGSALLFMSACDENKPKPTAAPVMEEKPAPAEPAPLPQSPPTLAISDSGPSVRGMSAMLTQPSGTPDAAGRAKLRGYLQEEEKFLRDKDVTVQVARMAKPEWVGIFLSELSQLSPARVVIATDTRSDFPKELEFVPHELVKQPDPCTLAGTITADRGTAIWKISGGAARKRGRGMGGPDLSMTADTILSMKKGCSSDLFFVSGAEGVEWGLIYDLAASGISLEKAELKRAVIPTKPATAGHKIEQW